MCYKFILKLNLANAKAILHFIHIRAANSQSFSALTMKLCKTIKSSSPLLLQVKVIGKEGLLCSKYTTHRF